MSVDMPLERMRELVRRGAQRIEIQESQGTIYRFAVGKNPFVPAGIVVTIESPAWLVAVCRRRTVVVTQEQDEGTGLYYLRIGGGWHTGQVERMDALPSA